VIVIVTELGTVKSVKMMQKNNQFAGYCFVTMGSKTECEKVIEKFNENPNLLIFGKKTAVVQIAGMKVDSSKCLKCNEIGHRTNKCPKKIEENKEKSLKRDKMTKDYKTTNAKLFIRNVSDDVTDDMVKNLLKDCGMNN
jgi:RNA recognition motif-containing protein